MFRQQLLCSRNKIFFIANILDDYDHDYRSLEIIIINHIERPKFCFAFYAFILGIQISSQLLFRPFSKSFSIICSPLFTFLPVS